MTRLPPVQAWLQWGRITEDAEMSVRGFGFYVIEELQWGRITEDAEMDLQDRIAINRNLLQWGRITADAEMLVLCGVPAADRVASMGPHH